MKKRQAYKLIGGKRVWYKGELIKISIGDLNKWIENSSIFSPKEVKAFVVIRKHMKHYVKNTHLLGE